MQTKPNKAVASALAGLVGTAVMYFTTGNFDVEETTALVTTLVSAGLVYLTRNTPKDVDHDLTAGGR